MSKFILVVCFLGIGCAPSPAEQCDTFVATFCDKVVECVGGASSDCVAATNKIISCERAVDVSSSYGKCLDDIDRISCASFIQNGNAVLPATCLGVVLTK